ncbi:K+/H+ antiporter [Egicoccus halophilus]|uniref:K+/H+ antiporter n=2 Tax=Egicoccus halophilus TaxID=1670830 RepID=A0A8J3AHF8_9ACTN|nr:K+/H+ antiporter [Egicoccus halophilus]
MQMTLGVDAFLLLAAVLTLSAVVVSALTTRFSRRLRVPGALLFLGLGMLVGDDGLDLVSLADAELVQNAGVVALLFILLEGGLTTKPTDLRLAAVPGLLLATVGVAATAGITALGVWLLLDVEVVTAALVGAVVGSTDAAAVFSMMRTTPLPRRVSALLRVESGSNDPIAVMLTVGLLATVDGGASPGTWAAFAGMQLLGGAVVGVGVGGLAVVLLRRLPLGIDGLYPIAVVALGVLAYGSAVRLGASGFVAVYLTGVLVGAYVPRHRRTILGFHEALANAAEIGLFLVLGLLVFPARLPAVALGALGVAAVLTLVARPAAVWLCTLGQGYDWRERTLLSAGGLKGAVPIVLATFPLTAGIDDALLVFDVVFFVVLSSVLVQGLALLPIVRRLGFEQSTPAWAPVAQALPLEGIEVDLVEVHVTEDLFLAGRRLAEVGVPGGTIVTAVIRRDAVLVPRGDTRIEVDDVLLLTVERAGPAIDRLTAWARGEGDPRR